MTLFLDPKKFSQLDEVEVLDGSESIPIIKGGQNKRVKVENLPIPDDIVESIVAGDNITVDDTDPSHPVISADDQIITEYVFNSDATPNAYTYNNWADLYETIRSNPGVPVIVTLQQNEAINLGANAILDNITFAGNGVPAITGGVQLAITGGTISSWQNGKITDGLGFGNTNGSYIFNLPPGITTFSAENGALLVSLGSQSFFNVGNGSILYLSLGENCFIFGSSIGASEFINVTGTGEVTFALSRPRVAIDSNVVKGTGTFIIGILQPANKLENISQINTNHSGVYNLKLETNGEVIKYENTESGLSAANLQDAIDEVADIARVNYLPDNIFLPIEARSKYAVVGSSDQQLYDDTGFELPNQGDFPDGGFDIYEEVVPLWGEFVALNEYSYGETFTITDPSSSGGDLIEAAVIWHNGKPSPYIEFTAQGQPGEDPRIHISAQEYSGVPGMLMRNRYTHDPETGTTTVWRPAGDFETPEDTKYSMGWIKVHEQSKGEPWSMKTGVTDTWKVGLSRGRRLISRIIVNDYSGANLADFNAANAIDEFTVLDGVTGLDWVSRGLGRIIDTTEFTDRWLSDKATGGVWGEITGSIYDQEDLVAAMTAIAVPESQTLLRPDDSVKAVINFDDQSQPFNSQWRLGLMEGGQHLTIRRPGSGGSDVLVIDHDTFLLLYRHDMQLLGQLIVGNSLDMSNTRIHNLADPSLPQDAATKAYADTKQSAIGYTPEDAANKDTDSTMAANSDTKYPSQKAVKTALAAKQDTLAYTPEDSANKDTDSTMAANSDTKYPSQKAVKTALATKQNSLGYTAENSANKDTDGTLAANSDTKYPSQKAAKTYSDTKIPLSYIDTDGTMAVNSDTKIASQKATRTYARKRIGTGTGKLPSFSVRDYRVLGDAYLNGVTTTTPSTNRWTFEFYEVTEPCTLDRVAIEVTTAGVAGKLVRMALYTADDYWQPQTLVQDFGTVATDVGAVPTMQVVTLSPALTIQPGRYVGIIIQDGAAAFRVLTAYALAANALNAAASTLPYRNIASLNGAGTVASGFASVSPAWERDVYSASGAMQYILRFREAV